MNDDFAVWHEFRVHYTDWIVIECTTFQMRSIFKTHSFQNTWELNLFNWNSIRFGKQTAWHDSMYFPFPFPNHFETTSNAIPLEWDLSLQKNNSRYSLSAIPIIYQNILCICKFACWFESVQHLLLYQRFQSHFHMHKFDCVSKFRGNPNIE